MCCFIAVLLVASTVSFPGHCQNGPHCQGGLRGALCGWRLEEDPGSWARPLTCSGFSESFLVLADRSPHFFLMLRSCTKLGELSNLSHGPSSVLKVKITILSAYREAVRSGEQHILSILLTKDRVSHLSTSFLKGWKELQAAELPLGLATLHHLPQGLPGLHSWGSWVWGERRKKRSI